MLDTDAAYSNPEKQNNNKKTANPREGEESGFQS